MKKRVNKSVDYGQIFAVTIFLVSGIWSPVFAEDKTFDLGTIVISATRLAESKYSVGKSVDIVSGEDMEESGYARVSDNLSTVPGVRVKQADGLGGLTTVRIRGLRSIDTKVTYEGLPFRDPSEPQGSANPFYQDLGTSGIGRVEVTRGTGSALWGSDAQGGVLAIYGRNGGGDPRANGGFEFGSFGTLREYVEVEGEKLGTDIYARIGRLDSEGITDHDSSGNTSLTAKVGHDFEGGARIEATYLGYNADAALRRSPQIAGGVLFNDASDENDRRENRLSNLGFHVSSPVGEFVDFSSRVGFLDSDRRLQFLPNSDGTGFYNDGGFGGQNLSFDNQVDLHHTDALTTTLGWQREVEWMSIRAKSLPTGDEEVEFRASRDDYYVQEHISLLEGRSVSTVGVRQSNHSEAKDRAVWDVATSYRIEETGTRLKGHAGTAFRAPSLYERNGAFLTAFGTFEIGNEGLSPERSRGFDLGFEQRLTDDLTAGTTFFRNDLINQIDYVGSGYRNIDGQGHTHGTESFVEFLRGNFDAKVSHTYTQRLANGTGAFDIPKAQIAGDIGWTFGKWRIGAQAVYVGNRNVGVFNTTTFVTDTIPEQAYTKVDAGVYYDPAKDITVYVRAENLFNEKYTEAGFRAPGTGVYSGVRTKF